MKNLIFHVPPALLALKGSRSARLSVSTNGVAVTWLLEDSLEGAAASLVYRSESKRSGSQVLAVKSLGRS